MTDDEMMEELRQIAANLMAGKGGEGPHNFTWFGPWFVVSQLTREEANDRVVKYGGKVRIWTGEDHVDAPGFGGEA